MRIFWASYFCEASSSGLKSEPITPAANAAVIEMIAGFLSGKIAAGFLSTSTQTVGLMIMSNTASVEPVTMDSVAPKVEKLRQRMDMSRAGKFALAAMAKARPTMKATFWPLKASPSAMASTPRSRVARLATLTSSTSEDFPPRNTFT